MAKMRRAFSQDLAWRAEALAFDVFTLLVRALPTDAASNLGGWFARRFGPLTRNHRTADRNLRLAFPDMDVADRRRLLDQQWDNVGRVFFELPLMDRLTPKGGRVEVAGEDRLAAIAAGGKPAVLISGHFSNWEVMAGVIVESGAPCEITYRAANNPHVDQRIIRSRQRYGVRLFAPKGGDGANDQKYDGGVAAPFFGRTVHTLPAAVRLALRFGVDLLPMSVQRLSGARFRCIVHEPIVLADTGDKSADVEAGVRQVNAFIEARVRERPHEWFWVHRRWPVEAYAELEAEERVSASDA